MQLKQACTQRLTAGSHEGYVEGYLFAEAVEGGPLVQVHVLVLRLLLQEAAEGL